MRGLRHFFVSLVTGILAGEIVFRWDQYFCGDINGENAAGGGAALGMIMLAFLASALLSEFAILVGIDLARHFGFIAWRRTWRIEIISMVLVIAMASAYAYEFTRNTCALQLKQISE